jgi:hypothetical protein
MRRGGVWVCKRVVSRRKWVFGDGVGDVKTGT